LEDELTKTTVKLKEDITRLRVIFCTYTLLVHIIIIFILIQEQSKITVTQLNSELSEKDLQLVMMEKELTKLKEDNKLLVKQFRERKDKRRRETIPQVCSF